MTRPLQNPIQAAPDCSELSPSLVPPPQLGDSSPSPQHLFHSETSLSLSFFFFLTLLGGMLTARKLQGV